MKKTPLRLRTFYPIFGIIFCFDIKIIYSKVCCFPAYVNLDEFTSFFLRRWQSDYIMSLRKQRPLLASLWMIGALVSISGMAIAGRELSSELNAFQISFTRSLFCLIALIIILFFIGFNKVKTAKPKLHLLRNTIHFGGQTGWLYGVAFLPLAEVFAIEFTAPIWTAILAVIFLKEPLTRYRTLGILLGFAGIMIILRPGIQIIQPAALIVLFATFCFASTYVFTRHMAATESPLTIIFYMNLVQLPIGLLASLPSWNYPTLESWPWILLIGLTGLGSHFCFAHAFRHADAAVVSPLDFMRLPLIALIGWAIYNESWDMMIFLGGIIIFSGNLINIFAEQKFAKK